MNILGKVATKGRERERRGGGGTKRGRDGEKTDI